METIPQALLTAFQQARLYSLADYKTFRLRSESLDEATCNRPAKLLRLLLGCSGMSVRIDFRMAYACACVTISACYKRAA